MNVEELINEIGGTDMYGFGVSLSFSRNKRFVISTLTNRPFIVDEEEFKALRKLFRDLDIIGLDE